MERVTFRVPEDVLKDVEQLVERGEYPNRSEAFRDALTELDGVGERRRLMTDGGVGFAEVAAMSEETPLDPLVEHPDGYGLYEVVVAADTDPRVVRKYLGRDVVNRAVYLIKGGVSPEDVDGELDGIRMEVDPVEIHSRFVVSTSEQAVDALEGCLDMGEFRRVDADE